ncbi:phosphoribosylformylglycinamidine synthase subunit PurL [Terriglobus sp.]|uniref:phosphoribosylformylglycinamidine synthase subunit PurL n=1 Tax=Terriglobus sp. TaxID=1889013 RepID=UPI003AFF8521
MGVSLRLSVLEAYRTTSGAHTRVFRGTARATLADVSQPTAIHPEAEVAVTGAPHATADIPKPLEASPAQLATLLKTHSITDEEYAKILAALGRTPSLTELGIYSVMWSEHCSYKSSRVHLKRLPTKGERTSGPGAVVQGPGENAGIIDMGDGWACAFKIESHNHPSYIEPYQGAATGVGGILRDIFTMGARPMAVMDSLRFGPLSPSDGAFSGSSVRPDRPSSDLSFRPEQSGVEKPASSTTSEPFHGATEDTSEEADAVSNRTSTATIDYARNRSVMEGVVHGVAGYGNCFGVPNLGGETRFEACYSGNPLLNAFALGLVRHDEIFYAKATGVGNPVLYVGAKTGRDGIHGATMASEEFTEGSEQKRPNVQMGDPFLEKLLLEACLEAMKTGAVAGIQDMGAAGLTCSTCEMGARGGVGLEIELDLVPQRDSGMSSYEIMLSESQERMLLVAHAGREQEVLDVFEKWGLDASVVGTVIPENRMRVRHHGELVADLSNESLTDDAPVYHRPVGEWKAPVPLDPPAWVLEELKKPRDYTADLLKLLASPNICSKRYIYEQYDSMVQTNTVFGPGQAEAGVIRIKGTGNVQEPLHSNSEGAAGFSPLNTAGENGALAPEAKPERGIAMALAGNGRWTYLDPKLGAMHAVAEAARKVACTGATPVAATNCLNFGNPQKPEIMAQLSLAIDGIAEACTALGTPITGGNVSLYNETKGEGIYPTPVLGVVGILDDVTKAVPSGFQAVGDTILLIGVDLGAQIAPVLQREFGSSEFARTVLQREWGTCPSLHLDEAAELNECLAMLASKNLLTSCSDVTSGGIAVALARASVENGVGCEVHLIVAPEVSAATAFFCEWGSLALVTCERQSAGVIAALMDSFVSVQAFPIGSTECKTYKIVAFDNSSDGFGEIECALSALSLASVNTLKQQLEAEVVLA